MKKVLLAVLLAAFAVGCEKEDKSSLSVTPDVRAIEFSADAMTATVTSAPDNSGKPVGTVLTTNGKAVFTVNASKAVSVTGYEGTWVHVAVSGKNFTVTADQNNSQNGRQPVRIAVSAGGTKKYTLDILQLSAENVITIEPRVSKIEFSADGRAVTAIEVPEGSPVVPGSLISDSYKFIFMIGTLGPGWDVDTTYGTGETGWLTIDMQFPDAPMIHAGENTGDTMRGPAEVKISSAGAIPYVISVVQRAAGVEDLLPSVETNPVDDITSESATLGGHILKPGTPAYTECGVCWATSQNPTTADNKAVAEAGKSGRFSVSVSDLTIGTTYYVRAYAINSVGTAYGGQVEFTTSDSSPILSTNEATNVTASSATLGGYILRPGAPAFTERGVCWSTSQNPTTAGNKAVVAGFEPGNFSTNVSGLTANATYYVRAYVIQSGIPVYGNEVSFTTTTTSIPAAPAGLTATAASSSQINLSWNASTGATGYKVERSANGTSGWTEIAPSVTATSYQNTGLSAGTTYYYRVRAYNGTGNSGYSNTANATTQTPSLVAPALSLVGSQPVSGPFTLRCSYTWPGLGATTDRYELEISENGGSTYSLLLTGADGDRTSPFSFNLETESGDAGKTFYFRARVRTSSEYTPYSTPVSVSVADVPPPIAVKYTRSNALQSSSGDSSWANTSYPNRAPAVGNIFLEQLGGGYTSGIFAHALYFNVNSQISGKNIKKAELRMYPSSLTMEPGVVYNIGTIASSWTSSLTYNQALKLNIYTNVTKAAPVTMFLPWVVDVTSSVRNWANGTWSNNGFLLSDPGGWIGRNAYRTTDFIGIENSDWDTVLYIEFQ